jgi:hypothetical protein
VIAAAAVQMLLLVLTGWLERREREAIAYLIEETASCAGSWMGGVCG